MPGQSPGQSQRHSSRRSNRELFAWTLVLDNLGQSWQRRNLWKKTKLCSPEPCKYQSDSTNLEPGARKNAGIYARFWTITTTIGRAYTWRCRPRWGTLETHLRKFIHNTSLGTHVWFWGSSLYKHVRASSCTSQIIKPWAKVTPFPNAKGTSPP